MAGYNVRFDIFRINYGADDEVGGAVITGTLLYHEVMARFQEQPDEQLLLQQGLETQRTYTANIIPGTLEIRERDEVEVAQPFDHHYHGDRFRIIRVRYSDFNPRDPRNYILLTLVRSVRSHAQQ